MIGRHQMGTVEHDQGNRTVLADLAQHADRPDRNRRLPRLIAAKQRGGKAQRVVQVVRSAFAEEPIELAEDAEFSARFPAERWARLRITLADGRTLVSEPARARGNPENPLSDAELLDKYRALATPVLGPERTARIEAIVGSLVTDAAALPRLRDALLESPEVGR